MPDLCHENPTLPSSPDSADKHEAKLSRRQRVAMGFEGGVRVKAPTHGHAPRSGESRTYLAWYSMHTRCRCPSQSKFAYYGGRGVTVCDRWASFAAFLEDMREAPAGLWLDRKDSLEPYEPGNCRWATPALQRRNQKRNRFVTCLGVHMVARDAETLLGFRHGTLVTWLARNPSFPGDVSQLYFVPWRNRRKLTWNSAGF